MSHPLDDPRLVRRLTKACRRAGARIRRWRAEGKPTGDSALNKWFGRLLLALVIAALGVQARSSALSYQLIAVVGLATLGIQIGAYRQRLETDPALGILAQLPVSPQQVFDRQSAGVWSAAVWAGVDAMGFWCVAWSGRDQSGPWWLLPLVGATHGLAMLAAVHWLLRWWPQRLGCAVMGITVLFILGMFISKGAMMAWPGVEPLLLLLRTVTPWGWIAALAAAAPADPLMATYGLAGIAALSVSAIIVGHRRLRAGWKPDPRWREAAGERTHEWFEEMADGESASTASIRDDASAAQGASSDEAWRQARQAPVGRSLNGLGWAGRRAAARFDAADRFMVDRLIPGGSDDSTGRWAILLAALPAACALAGVASWWGMVGLAGILIGRRMRWRAAVAVIMAGVGIVRPDLAIFGLILPGALAVLLVMPFFGGSWGGLPMGGSPLGIVPRRWTTLYRIMVTVTAWRLVAALPVVVLVAIALGVGAYPRAGLAIVTGWVACALAMPWITALLLIRRTRGGVDLDHGRWWLTGGGVVMMCIQAALTLALFIMIFADARAIVGAAMAIALSAVITALQMLMLRRAYRRYIDLVPPAPV